MECPPNRLPAKGTLMARRRNEDAPKRKPGRPPKKRGPGRPRKTEAEKKEPKISKRQLALLSEREKKFDISATQDSCIADLRRLQEENEFVYISRNFYRINGYYSDSTWNQFFGTFKEFRRQAGLELSRHQHKFERQIAKHASHDVYRDYFTDEVLPYHLKYEMDTSKGRYKTIMVASDLHDKEMDMFYWSIFLDTVSRLQPDIIVLNGDIFDLYEFSRFDIDPRQWDIKGRFNFVKKHVFQALREKAPNAQIDLIIGNHEIRILKLLANKTPNIRVLLSDVMGLTLADLFGLDMFEINLVAKLDLASFNVSDDKEQLKENYQVYYECYAACHFKKTSLGISGTNGHTHAPAMWTFMNVPSGKCSWVNTGCFAASRAEFVFGEDKWMGSFVIADVDTLSRTVNQRQILLPGDHVVVEGVRYTRPKGGVR